MTMEWRSLADNWILQPRQPKAAIHFLGGAFVGATPHVAYDALLSSLARAGYAIVATPFITDPNHRQISASVANRLQAALAQMSVAHLPLFGLGHSLGCKLHLLNTCEELAQPSRPWRAGNILMAYSNASFRRDLPDWVPLEFEPSPAATEALVDRHYTLDRTLLIQFERDTIDNISALKQQLSHKLGPALEYRLLPGDHGTCAGGRYPLPVSGEFSPVDAIGQFLYQTLNRENYQLYRTLRSWLDRQIQHLQRSA